MAHFAELDENNVVINVTVVNNDVLKDENGVEQETLGIEHLTHLGGRWVQTSYNTVGGIHKLGGTPFRKNYAGFGYIYDEARDAFIPPKPETGNWILDEETCCWKEDI